MFDYCLYFNTTALARRLEREWAEAFQPFGLTPPQAFLLRAVLEQPGLPARDLATGLSISRPTATRALDGLEAKKLIIRNASDADGRESFIFPTSGAKAMHAALNEAGGKATRRLKKMLGDDVFASTVSQLQTVRAALS
jgi:DNA-binding MarR family transcriptional regulator